MNWQIKEKFFFFMFSNVLLGNYDNLQTLRLNNFFLRKFI